MKGTTKEAQQLVEEARSELGRLVDHHAPRSPLAIREAMDALSGRDRGRADRAFQSAIYEEFALMRHTWAAATDGNRLLGDVVEEIADEKRGSG